MKLSLLLALPLVAALALTAEPAAQAAGLLADCGPIEGTVAVADDDRITPDLARISADDARTAALARFAGATVVDVDLEEEDGFLVYEVDLVHDQAEVDVLVDAGSGEVLCSERD